MEKRKLDNLGVDTSLLGFGCMRFPVKPDGLIDQAQSQQMIDYALANGVNYIDTAYFYHDGESESFLGEALKKHDRQSYFLATKLPVWILKDRQETRKVVEEQLKRLNTGYIDFYLLHTLDRKKWDVVLKNDILSILEELREEGKIRYIGFSFHDEYSVFEEILQYRKWDFCQIQLNYMDTEEQAGIKGYHLAEDLGIPIIVMEPVRGGALANFSEEMNAKFKALNSQASIPSYALRFVGGLPNVKVVLSGMSSMEQVQDNIKTFSSFTPLSEGENRVIQEIKETMQARVQNGCTGCGYCMPCPQGVNIPENFKVWNTYHMYQKFEAIRFGWAGIGRKAKANNCIQCGLCEEKCPQKIKISEDMPRVWADLNEGKWK
ncbi:aldo/keto reductase [Anaerotignum sp.]|uniref:aldo/keto reductase n=1 Tax=Anaerotignum sp. TaxID=2039241 RepID=UPI0028AD79BE|nr:aldo/keto reductase [Anaerotignum sp.]